MTSIKEFIIQNPKLILAVIATTAIAEKVLRYADAKRQVTKGLAELAQDLEGVDFQKQILN